jgi:hypothetical protein
MKKIMLKIQATSNIVIKMNASLELSTPLIANPILDRPTDELYAADAIYNVKTLYSEEIVIA